MKAATVQVTPGHLAKEVEVPMPSHLTTSQRFWAKVEFTDTCWLWTAGCDTSGYGHISVKGRLRRAHRVAYELLLGPFPAGLESDHLCRVRRCVRPSHIEAVTHAVNVQRGLARFAGYLNASKSHCPQGHPYDAANTYIGITGKGGSCRVCRACRRDWQRRRRASIQLQLVEKGQAADG